MKKLTFENETCGRCGGSGHYSYCPMYGTTCFKCHGVGALLTKRGQAAQAFYTRLLSKPTTELRPGDKVYTASPVATNPGIGFVSHWYPVQEVYLQTAERTGGSYSIGNDGQPNYHGYVVECQGMRFVSEDRDKLWRVAATAEQKQAARAQALEYQATLTKQGTPHKRSPSCSCSPYAWNPLLAKLACPLHGDTKVAL